MKLYGMKKIEAGAEESAEQKTGPKPRFFLDRCRPLPGGVPILRPVRIVVVVLGLGALVDALLVVDPQQAVATVKGKTLETVGGTFVAPGTVDDVRTLVDGLDFAATADGVHVGYGAQVVDGQCAHG